MPVKCLEQSLEQRYFLEGLVSVVITTDLTDFRYGLLIGLLACLRQRQCFKHKIVWFLFGNGKTTNVQFCFVLYSLPNDLFLRFNFLIFTFLERGEGRKKEREKNRCARETDWLPLSCF